MYIFYDKDKEKINRSLISLSINSHIGHKVT